MFMQASERGSTIAVQEAFQSSMVVRSSPIMLKIFWRLVMWMARWLVAPVWMPTIFVQFVTLLPSNRSKTALHGVASAVVVFRQAVCSWKLGSYGGIESR